MNYKVGDIVVDRFTQEYYLIKARSSADNIWLHPFDKHKSNRAIDCDMLHENFKPIPNAEKKLWSLLSEI